MADDSVRLFQCASGAVQRQNAIHGGEHGSTGANLARQTGLSAKFAHGIDDHARNI